MKVHARDQGPMLVAALSRYADELARGAIVAIEPGRVRVRTGPQNAPRRRPRYLGGQSTRRSTGSTWAGPGSPTQRRIMPALQTDHPPSRTS